MFTPGEWDTRWHTISLVWCGDKVIADVPRIGDRNLIKCAPDMYELLLKLRGSRKIAPAWDDEIEREIDRVLARAEGIT